jgi:hypothetical protein
MMKASDVWTRTFALYSNFTENVIGDAEWEKICFQYAVCIHVYCKGRAEIC